MAKIPGVKDLTLTTNASLLARKAGLLRDAGLNRVTVSLDALDHETFTKMNDVDHPVEQVLEGIEVAAKVGLGPIKINAVIQRAVNEHAVVDLARRFRGTGHIVRFIEYMDVGTASGLASRRRGPCCGDDRNDKRCLPGGADRAELPRRSGAPVPLGRC